VGIGGVWWQGATGTLAGGFGVYATGHEACSVAGTVELEIRDSEGRILPIRVHQMEPAAAVPVVLLPDLGTPRPAGGLVAGRGMVLVYWMNWCGPTFDGDGTLAITIPAVGPVAAQFGRLYTPRCDVPDQPSVIDVAPIVRQDPNA
jgi:hypothetical protein